MAFCCCPSFQDNLLLSKHLRLWLSRKGWEAALALVSPGGNICHGFQAVEHTAHARRQGRKLLLTIYSGVFLARIDGPSRAK